MEVFGLGHALGSKSISNRETSKQLNLPEDWLFKATGIEKRVVCSSTENVIELAIKSIRSAISINYNLIEKHQEETLLIYIQNGMTHLTPPPGNIISYKLGMPRLKSLSVDGACTEPINMIEIASLYLQSKSYKFVIVCASSNFLPIVDMNDSGTAGLFGAGSGTIIFSNERPDEPCILGVDIGTNSEYWDLGTVPLVSINDNEDSTFDVKFNKYVMKGKPLAKVALSRIPITMQKSIAKSNWKSEEVNLYISHQPNAKLLEIGIRQMKLNPDKVFCPVGQIGNLGPASILCSFSMAYEDNLFQQGDKLVLVSFGLGFNFGSICLNANLI